MGILSLTHFLKLIGQLLNKGLKMKYAKIDLFTRKKLSNEWVYICSTIQAKNCKQAKENFIAKNPQYDSGTVRAFFSDNL